jgi:ABC-type iron transport system FetAB ATPase subunit
MSRLILGYIFVCLFYGCQPSYSSVVLRWVRFQRDNKAAFHWIIHDHNLYIYIFSRIIN